MKLALVTYNGNVLFPNYTSKKPEQAEKTLNYKPFTTRLGIENGIILEGSFSTALTSRATEVFIVYYVNKDMDRISELRSLEKSFGKVGINHIQSWNTTAEILHIYSQSKQPYKRCH